MMIAQQPPISEEKFQQRERKKTTTDRPLLYCRRSPDFAESSRAIFNL